MMKGSRLQNDKKIEDSIIQDVANLFRLKRNRSHHNQEMKQSKAE